MTEEKKPANFLFEDQPEPAVWGKRLAVVLSIVAVIVIICLVCGLGDKMPANNNSNTDASAVSNAAENVAGKLGTGLSTAIQSKIAAEQSNSDNVKYIGSEYIKVKQNNQTDSNSKPIDGILAIKMEWTNTSDKPANAAMLLEYLASNSIATQNGVSVPLSSQINGNISDVMADTSKNEPYKETEPGEKTEFWMYAYPENTTAPIEIMISWDGKTPIRNGTIENFA